MGFKMYFTISTYCLSECGLVAAYQNFVQNQPTPPLQRTTFLCLSLVPGPINQPGSLHVIFVNPSGQVSPAFFSALNGRANTRAQRQEEVDITLRQGDISLKYHSFPLSAFSIRQA